ncbi:MAG: hypothetical protein V1725_01880 [archaeon]
MTERTSKNVENNVYEQNKRKTPVTYTQTNLPEKDPFEANVDYLKRHLGAIAQTLGTEQKAIREQIKFLKVIERKTKEESPQYRALHAVWGDFCLAHPELFKDAEEHYTQSKDLARLNNLAFLYVAHGNADLAQPIYDKLVQRNFIPEAANTLDVVRMNTLASQYEQKGQPETAKKIRTNAAQYSSAPKKS